MTDEPARNRSAGEKAKKPGGPNGAERGADDADRGRPLDVSRSANVDVRTFEEHSSVLPEWQRRRATARTLICLDAHLDLLQISPQRLSRLEPSNTWESFQRLEKPHQLLPDEQFSFSLEDFLFPAHRLGMIDRLIWVAPPHVPTGYSRATLDQLEQMAGVEFEELANFRRAGAGWIEGTLLGLPMTICNYLQLEQLSLPVDSLIDIDTDYFVAVPGDRAWIDPKNVFEVLNRLDVKPTFVTLSRSVDSGFLPVRYRYLADYLAALWQNRGPEAAHYERLLQCDCLLRAGNRAAVVAHCRRELVNHPRCAATWYLLGFAEPESGRAERHRRRAAELDPGYQPSVLRSACGIRNRKIPVSIGTLLALERQLTEAKPCPEELALARVAMGIIYCAKGQLDRALANYRQAEQRLGHVPELALEIGKLLSHAQRADEALPFFEAALGNDATRPLALVEKARLLVNLGSLHEALQHLETARSLAPAWGEILAMLTTLYQQVGNNPQAQNMRRQFQRRRLQTEQLENALRAD